MQRPKSKVFQEYCGRNILREALFSGAEISEIYFETSAAKAFVESLKTVKKQNIPLVEGIPASMKHQAHQGVAFKTAHRFYEPFDREEIRKHPFLLLCNHVEDVHNLGSIARCGAGFGARILIHEEKRSAELTAAAVKASAGLAFRLKFMKVDSLAQAVKDISSWGFHPVGLDAAPRSLSLFEWVPDFPLALILGSEGEGIEPAVKARCETLVRIPMEKNVESLNVSHAAAIAMNWAYRTQTQFR